MTREVFVPYDVRYLAESYRLGMAWWITCLSCLRRYVSLLKTETLPKPCPACGAALDAIGAIGIDQAVGLIAERRAP